MRAALLREIDEWSRSIDENLKQLGAQSKDLKAQVARLSGLERQQQDLASQDRELSLRSMAELEALEEQERTTGEEPEPLEDQLVLEATSSVLVLEVDWSSFDMSAFPSDWLESPSPSAGPGFFGEFLHLLRATEILNGFPCIIFWTKSFPLD